jgi:hypothetical protein
MCLQLGWHRRGPPVSLIVRGQFSAATEALPPYKPCIGCRRRAGYHLHCAGGRGLRASSNELACVVAGRAARYLPRWRRRCIDRAAHVSPSRRPGLCGGLEKCPLTRLYGLPRWCNAKWNDRQRRTDCNSISDLITLSLVRATMENRPFAPHSLIGLVRCRQVSLGLQTSV